MSKSKYEKGEVITSIDDMMNQEFIYFRDKVTHCGWFGSWQLRMTKRFIDNGFIRYAVKKDKEVFKDE